MVLEFQEVLIHASRKTVLLDVGEGCDTEVSMDFVPDLVGDYISGTPEGFEIIETCQSKEDRDLAIQVLNIQDTLDAIPANDKQFETGLYFYQKAGVPRSMMEVEKVGDTKLVFRRINPRKAVAALDDNQMLLNEITNDGYKLRNFKCYRTKLVKFIKRRKLAKEANGSEHINLVETEDARDSFVKVSK